MSMARQNLYYNTTENLYCFMLITDSRLKKEKGWKLWSIEQEPPVGPDEFDIDDPDGFERDLREAEEDLKYRDDEDFDEWGNPIQYG